MNTPVDDAAFLSCDVRLSSKVSWLMIPFLLTMRCPSVLRWCHGCQAESDARRIEELEAALAVEQAQAEEQAAKSKAQLKVG